MVAWNSARTKVQLKLSVQRTRMLQEKTQAMAKKERKEIANLVERGKVEFARAKVEACIAQDIHIELLEIMELYCETLLSRFALLDLNSKEPDPAVKTPLCAIIHAAPRTELRELHVLREMLMARYGRDFAVAAVENEGSCVPERVTSRLRVETPDPSLVDMYINEICMAYNVPFSSPLLPRKDATDDDAGGGGGVIEPPPSSGATEAAQPTASEAAKAGAMAKTAPPATKETTAAGATGAAAPTAPVATAGGAGTTAATGRANEQKELDDLEARFAALKRR